LATILTKAGLVTADDLHSSAERADRANKKLWEGLLDDRIITEDQMAETLARYLRLPCVRLASTTIASDVAGRVPEALALKHTCVPVKLEGDDPPDEAASSRPVPKYAADSAEAKSAARFAASYPTKPASASKPKPKATLLVAMVDPTDLGALQAIEFAAGMKIVPAVSTRTEIVDAIGRSYSPDQWLQRFLASVPAETDSVHVEGLEPETDEDPASKPKSASTVKLVNLILLRAIESGASDLHIEPSVNELRVRLRRDGMLTDMMQLPKWLLDSVVSRLKILAKLNIAERRRPQDGRLKIESAGREVDLRLSTLPTCYGEKIVLRVLAGGDRLPTLEALGMSGKELEMLRRAAGQPQGMILVTGPTGSGKTTSLYSILAEKSDTSKNVVTVEDPVEIHLPRANQIQVNNATGLTFAAALRSILRQDPDVILVGEIRDSETAEIAFHAAMTGHMVFSTLHTNNTIATISRLLDLNVDPFLVSSALNLIIAQRLARRICDRCKELDDPPLAVRQRLGLESANFQFYHGKGCDACGQSGYSGRVGLYEFLPISPAIRRLISSKADESEMRRAAANSGMTTLLQQAMMAVKDGVTSLDEVLRVVQMQEDEASFCPNCSAAIHPDFTVCPFCMHEFRHVCGGCKQELRADWKTCPYCNIPVGTRAAESVPATFQALPEPAPAPPPRQPAESAKRPYILVVDDDPVNRRVAVGALEKMDTRPEVGQAADGFEALSSVQHRCPDAILLDISMPGMNGFEVCERLRADVKTAFVPILMLTANVDEDSRSKGFLVGTDDYMGKPVSVPELHARVKRLMRRTYGV
jgi:type IV pilus assembly protein PilB